MNNTLLRTKLQGPRVRAARVERAQLAQRLDSLLTAAGHWRRKVTLISAPAGYGKTTLVGTWQAAAGCDIAWLSLEAGDDDLPRFVTYLVAALQAVSGDTGKESLALLASGQRVPAAALLGPLLNQLATHSRPLALILDDYHTVQAEAVHQALTFFVEHQPPQLHLFILTREDPPLPLARWRAAGTLAEIRRDDLRFSRAEAAAFLQDVQALPLNAEQVAALAARTEGWIAGLQLAALALQGHPDPAAFVESFAGSNRYILDYLLDEVFRQQPAAVREFLLTTAILERFTAPLCAALMTTRAGPGGDDPDAILAAARSHLAYLERRNLFVVPLDDRRQWFRYHHLFAELLRHQLRLRRWPTQALHRAAGAWYAAREMEAAAVEHFLAGEAWDEAAQLVVQVSEGLLRRGESQTLASWIQRIPEEVIQQQPQLSITYAWALIFGGQPETAAAYLDAVASAARAEPGLRRSLLEARAYIARLRQDLPRTIALSEQVLALTPATDDSTRAVVAVGLGIAYWQNGQAREAEPVLMAAMQAAARSRNDYARLVATGFLGTVRATLGRLLAATQLLAENAGRAGPYPPAAGVYHILGALLYEQNELEEAGRRVEQAVLLARRSANVELIEGACRQLARVRQALGDEAGARAALAEAEQAVSAESAPLAHARIADAHVQLALAQGDMATATYWASRRALPVDASPFYPQLDLTPARLLLADGRREAAARHLQKQAERAEAGGWQYGLVETRTLQALAAADEATALSFLALALALARAGGYVRTFVDKGEALATLLRLASARGLAAVHAATLLSAFPGAAEAAPLVTELSARRTPRPVLVEPLSERELEIVALLAQQYTNAEMAQALAISLNTVKTHLRHIYEKLGVHDRRAAATRAHELNLVPPER